MYEDVFVDNIVGEHIDEFEELVVRRFIVHALLDFLKERDFIGGDTQPGRGTKRLGELWDKSGLDLFHFRLRKMTMLRALR